MIEPHAFNTRWFGAEAGLVRDPAFFDLPGEEQAALLAPWAFVEARGVLGSDLQRKAHRAGFLLADVQIPFRIAVGRVESTPSLAALTVHTAAEEDFAVGEVQPFRHERFALLPGVDGDALDRRYRAWSEDLIAAAPELALEVRGPAGVEGWFLSRETDAGLELTLAMLARDARITGHHLYHRALVHYRAGGARVGHASFSVSNSAVQNIYASLGARFLTPQGCWLWSPTF